MGVGNITKAVTFKSFLHLIDKYTQLVFFLTVLFDTFMSQKLSDYFWGLHKNMNYAFPLTPTYYFFIKITRKKTAKFLFNSFYFQVCLLANGQ